MVAELWRVRNLRKQCVSIVGACLATGLPTASVDSKEPDYRERFSAAAPWSGRGKRRQGIDRYRAVPSRAAYSCAMRPATNSSW